MAQAIPTYPINVFKLPVSVCKEIDAMLAKFWWGQKEDETKMHWVSQRSLGMTKWEGGRGFRNLQDFNLALLAKQTWRILHEPNALWVKVLMGRYFPNGNFLEATKRGRASWAWASIIEGRNKISQGLQWQVFTGSSSPLIWPHEKSRIYTVRSGYHQAHTQSQSSTATRLSGSSSIYTGLWKLICNLQSPPKIQHFMWKVLRNYLATTESLHYRKITENPLPHLFDTS